MTSAPRGHVVPETAAVTGRPAIFGDGAGLGLALLAMATAVPCLWESGTPDAWPDSLGFGLFSTAAGLLLVWPAYLGYVAVLHGILTLGRCSPATQRRWRVWPPALALAAVIGHLANSLRPAVAFRSATGLEAPASLAQFHRSRSSGLMWSLDVAWFACAPADLRAWIGSAGLAPATNVPLPLLVESDPHLRRSPVRSRLSGFDASVGYQRGSNVLNFSTSDVLWTTPAHDHAVWIRRQSR